MKFLFSCVIVFNILQLLAKLVLVTCDIYTWAVIQVKLVQTFSF